MANPINIKVYHGYGHSRNLVVYGHVFKNKIRTEQKFSNSSWVNLSYLLKLFSLKPFPFADVQLSFMGKIIKGNTERDGFFKFEWTYEHSIAPGLHPVEIMAFSDNGTLLAMGEGKIYISEKTQYGIISDIDDTILISHSKKLFHRLRELIVKNPQTRKLFKDVQKHYVLLATAHTTMDQPNPFFYVSSSEWNLYDYLKDTFRHHNFPEGVFLLNSIKNLKSFLKSGKTGHEGKLLRVMRIIHAFPDQKFVFLGDNSQKDPVIYFTIAEKYASNIAAVYIRNIYPKKTKEAEKYLSLIQSKGIPVCMYRNSTEAIEHSKKIGLIE